MTRTQVLQEIRQMRFEEACRGWQARRLTKEEAARLLVVRTETLYRERYEGWNVKRFYSFYRREHAGTRSYTVRLIRQTESLPTGSLAGLGRAPCADRAPGSVLSRNR